MVTVHASYKSSMHLCAGCFYSEAKKGNLAPVSSVMQGNNFHQRLGWAADIEVQALTRGNKTATWYSLGEGESADEFVNDAKAWLEVVVVWYVLSESLVVIAEVEVAAGAAQLIYLDDSNSKWSAWAVKEGEVLHCIVQAENRRYFGKL
jgi:hypothetical protein